MAYNPQGEAMLQQAVAETIQPIAHMEKNYNATDTQRMIIDYVGRTGKRVLVGGKPLQQAASDFAYKFFESFWKAFGESEWLDQVDFTWIVGAGLRVYMAPALLANTSEEEFWEAIGQATALGFDSSRYYSWGSHALKSVIPGKATQKNVRNALDNTREELLKQSFDTAENFVSAWVKGSADKLRSNLLPQDQALKLFNTMIEEGGGIPLWLVQAAGGLTDSIKNEVANAVSSSFPAGGGGGFASMGAAGGGMGSWGAAPSAFNPMASMFGGAWGAAGGMGMGSWGAAAGGGKGKMGAWGYSPY